MKTDGQTETTTHRNGRGDDVPPGLHTAADHDATRTHPATGLAAVRSAAEPEPTTVRASTWIGGTTGVAWAAGLAFHHGTAGLLVGVVAGLILAVAMPRKRSDGPA